LFPSLLIRLCFNDPYFQHFCFHLSYCQLLFVALVGKLARRLFNSFGRLPVLRKQLESAERVFNKFGLLILWICATVCQTVCFDLDWKIFKASREDVHNLLSAPGATVSR
jgi:hypothetical protein